MRAGYAGSTLWLALASSVLADYTLTDSFVGHDFLDSFTWETFDDPTHGRVNYVDQATALGFNLSFASNTKFVMRADDTKTVAPSARGRDSVRITSKNAYDEAMMVLDLNHMPYGCSQWPAFWTMSKTGPWPNGGEIDVIEGVNQNAQNLASLHTTPNCTMQPGRAQDGTPVSNNCDSSVNYNQGCGTSFNSPRSFGPGFNNDGGGWFVMQKSRTAGINVWFWSRDDPSTPREVYEGADTMKPMSSWGMADASFPVDMCDYSTHFNAHQMIFDLTFCGDWAGTAFASAGCGSGTCEDYVNNNPAAFTEAYWEINSLRVYT